MEKLLTKWLQQNNAQYILDSRLEFAESEESLYLFVQRIYKYTINRFDKEYYFWRGHWEIGTSEAVDAQELIKRK